MHPYTLLLGGGGSNITLMSGITLSGLTSNLKLCLDSGDGNSYASGQSWLDRSGGGYDFFLGANGSATSTDPTFTGVAGAPQSYWLFDGGDYFTYDTTNETWMQNLHKNNAAFTILAIYYRATSPGTTDALIRDTGSGSVTGIQWHIYTNDKLNFGVRDTVNVLEVSSDTAVAIGAWSFIAISLNEAAGAGGSFFYTNGNYNQVGGSNTFNGTYTTPSAGNATTTLQICADGSGTLSPPNLDRLAGIAVWSSALSKANLDTLFNIMRSRFKL